MSSVHQAPPLKTRFFGRSLMEDVLAVGVVLSGPLVLPSDYGTQGKGLGVGELADSLSEGAPTTSRNRRSAGNRREAATYRLLRFS